MNKTYLFILIPSFVFLLYNSQILPENELRLPLTNRAFQYNDGFFETIILENGTLRFWPEHQARIKEAASVLGLTLPKELLNKDFLSLIRQLAEQNQCGNLARVKLKVWRAGEGLYTPQTDAADWLVTAHPMQKAPIAPLQVGICQTVRTLPSPFSSFKGIQSPVYVLASREKALRSFDDLILLDPSGNLAELTYSNLFWVKGETLYTPGLQTGCLNGIMRRKLLQWALRRNWQVNEGLFQPNELTAADAVFSGNVTGLRIIQSLEGKNLTSKPQLITQLQEEVFAGQTTNAGL
ncbi:aminotransferase class IV [Rufibacter latericius]|uniref:aminotransferase class IV n=1 Tax=Rufibacter latericius TaxID=2487040 RepID=UPI001401E9B9|nr:aminotransferase class IV [Rufibacter latericius]